MYTEMRLKKRQLSRPEAEDILARGLYGVLSLNGGSDGYAYGVPLSYTYQENKIYLHGALEGKKLDLLRRNNKVSFCVVLEAEPLADKYTMKYRSAIGFGTSHEVEDRDEKLAALIALVEKYYRDRDHIERGKKVAAESLDRTTVIRLDLDHLTGKVRQ